MTGNVAVLGESDFVKPFSVMGLDTFVVLAERKAVDEAAITIAEKKYSLVVVSENVAHFSQEAFSGLQDRPDCCVVVVPFTTEPEGFAVRELSKVLKMATGIDIVSNQ